jgi:2-phospho-L-lactate guanylyltransferase
MTWTAVVPVKRLSLAKTRLHLAEVARDDLAMAFALDTVQALLEASTVDRVIVVTDDRRARHAFEARSQADDPMWRGRVSVVPDVPDAGLNTALAHGAGVALALDPTTGIVAVSADLPALVGAEIDAVLTSVTPDAPAFVADAAGIGTTVYAAPPGVTFGPAFGRRSRAQHVHDGARELHLAVPRARRDVDTAVDLWDARRLGVGPATTRLLATAAIG